MLIRAPDATHVYTGMDLARLGGAMKPSVVVTAADLDKIGTRVPEFYAGDLFCPVGKTPLYLGQPVALLIFETFDAFDQARLALRDGTFVKFGEETGPVAMPNYGAFRFTRVAGATPDAPDVYSPIQAGWVSPGRFAEHGASGLVAAREGNARRLTPRPRPMASRSAASSRRKIRRFWCSIASSRPNPSIRCFSSRNPASPGMIGKSDKPRARAWRAVALRGGGVIAHLLGEARAPFKPARINAQFAYVGGGFGGRDHTPFLLYVALAAMFFAGRPVRLAHDRYQQFQGGIKRHAFKMRSRIGVDRATGKIQAFAADHVLDGGGLANYSPSVAAVGATAAIGIYDIPKVDVTTVALHSRGVTAGSMRGYGTLQTMTALEVLIDEVAAALPLDPIEFRRRNALGPNGRTMTGNPYSVSVRTPEILDKLEKHPIWQQRAQEKAGARRAFSSGPASPASPRITAPAPIVRWGASNSSAEGKISIYCDHVEMGNGIGTALANRVALHLGRCGRRSLGGAGRQLRRAGARHLRRSLYDGPEDAGRSRRRIRAGCPRSVRRPVRRLARMSARTRRLKPRASSSASDCGRRRWNFGTSPRTTRAQRIGRRRNGRMGSSSCPASRRWRLPALAATAHARNLVTGAVAHSFSRWAWSRARFRIAGEQYRAEIDALAVRRGGSKFQRIDRVSVKFPPTDNNRIGTVYTSMCGTLVRVEIERATGVLRIAKAYSVLECGQPLVPEVVLGQAQGGFAMGVGYALLETLPPYEDGPGNGQWNLGKYLVARGSDLPLRDLEIEMLPPLTPDEPPKGMAEVVMIPVVPAILNAIFDATGRRFQSLPVTSNMLKGALA